MESNFIKAANIGKLKYSIKKEGPVNYGTAGFRLNASKMDYIVYRMGLLAVLRSCDKKAAIGLMITASHNPVQDNGIKLVDPAGEMLAEYWETYATDIVNKPDDGLAAELDTIVASEKIDTKQPAVVFIGRDTRPSSDGLRDAAVAGIEALGATVHDLGIVSTPVLHFVVTCHNNNKYGTPSKEGYYRKLTEAFKEASSKADAGNYTKDLFYDGANGVGSLMMADMAPMVNKLLEITLCNTGEGILNHMCGADHVKTRQQWPEGVPEVALRRCASVDGDADRLVYSYLDEQKQFHLVDGDKIAALIAEYIKDLLAKAGLNLNLGVVQTAYANGASTFHIEKNVGVTVACAKTGVKNLHSMAVKFDIGVYFEANGHGTVVFSGAAKKTIAQAAKENEHAQRLSKVIDVINETVGDAISDMLLVETILQSKGWSVADWDNTYTDLPNRLSKVQVKDRNIFVTSDKERKCDKPENLQPEIDKLVAKYSKSRCFVRPSGTEDVVRVYAEAATQEQADSLASDVVKAVFDLAGGTGDRPS